MFTIHLTVPEGQSITPQHTVIWMVKKSQNDPDEAAVLDKRLSNGALTIQNDGSSTGTAELTGTISPQQSLDLFNTGSGGQVSFVTEVRVVTPNGTVQPRAFQSLSIQDTVIDQIVQDSELD